MPRALILLALLACDGRDDKAETGTIATDDDGDSFFTPEDCDDTKPDINPDALDVCGNSVDEDCDGEDLSCPPPCDEAVDGDGDGFPASEDCGGIADCDDADATVNPGEPERCDGVDNDCDGEIDEPYEAAAADETDTGEIETDTEGVPDETLNYTAWYLDLDEDGYGDVLDVTYACTQPDGYVDDSTDCDDLSEEDHPGAEERCDDEDDDDNCDGLSDDDDPSTTDYVLLYSDNDGDGYGAAVGYTIRDDLCDPPDEGGWSRDNQDCDDEDAAVNPAATEICDDADTDEDCDGLVDDADDSLDLAGTFAWYADADADGYVLLDVVSYACDEPAGYSAEAEADCDDEDVLANPGALDYCDGKDLDCDGETDEDDSVDASTWYFDLDRDGYGDAGSPTLSCTVPEDYVADDTDCDDSDADINPGEEEDCGVTDRDCDGDSTAGATDTTTYYADKDLDGYGWVGSPYEACTKPDGYVLDATDCDDTDRDTYELEPYYYDGDGDDYGLDDVTKLFCGSAIGRWVSHGGDCDDDHAKINPGANELCNGYDDDCDALVDDDDEVIPSSLTLWYEDADRDGYGSEASGYSHTCEAPSGYVANGEDCNDENSEINPAASESCDATDNDCDGEVDEGLTTYTWGIDGDGDGYGDEASATVSCGSLSSSYVKGATDCDDEDADIHPGVTERCDGVDADCSGDDEACMAVATESIALEPNVSGSAYVEFPEVADDTLAFIAVGKLIEHSDDQCDFETTIIEEDGYYSFDVDLEHCGYGHYDSLYGFEATAVVLSSIGRGASFSSFDLAVHGGGYDTDSLDLSTADARDGTQLCAVYSADGEGDNDAEWNCEAGLSGDDLTGEMYSGWGDGDNWAGARFMNIVPGDNVDITVKSFTCDLDGSTSVTHTIDDSKGDSHQAMVALTHLGTSEGKHMSFESSCSLSGDDYTCDILCYGSGRDFWGVAIFLDGDF